MSMRFVLTSGEEAMATAFSSNVLSFVSPRAYAPGAPIVLARTDREGRIEGRSLGSKRRDDGAFEVRARLVNLRREERLELESLLA